MSNIEKAARVIFESMAQRWKATNPHMVTVKFDDQGYGFTRQACLQDAAALHDAGLLAGPDQNEWVEAP